MRRFLSRQPVSIIMFLINFLMDGTTLWDVERFSGKKAIYMSFIMRVVRLQKTGRFRLRTKTGRPISFRLDTFFIRPRTCRRFSRRSPHVLYGSNLFNSETPLELANNCVPRILSGLMKLGSSFDGGRPHAKKFHSRISIPTTRDSSDILCYLSTLFLLHLIPILCYLHLTKFLKYYHKYKIARRHFHIKSM